MLFYFDWLLAPGPSLVSEVANELLLLRIDADNGQSVRSTLAVATVAVRPGQWQAVAWRAERRSLEQWGRKDTVVPSDVPERELDAEIERELERLAGARQAVAI
jgi:hypothetical protein